MQEDFLHYIWKHKKFATPRLHTTTSEIITLLSGGQHNTNAGPDFFNAQLEIGGQLWAGNVEIHIKSSDWYVHNHENDSAYDNVILHVVYEHDTEIFRKDNTVIPTLELKNFIHKEVLERYQYLFSNQHKWIKCENEFETVNDFVINHWLERLYFERLERKSNEIELMLQHSKNDWEAVLFKLLAKNFGLKVNGEAFLSMATSFEFNVVRKTQSEIEMLEALFYGQAGLLEDHIENAYYLQLKKDYEFLKQKFSLSNTQVMTLQFFRLRPPNFPTIRLSQLAMLYHEQHNLFSQVVAANTLEELYHLLKVSTSPFWNEHFTFSKTSKSSKKSLSTSFIDLLVINTILPLKFCYARYHAQPIDEKILSLVHHIYPEKNAIVNAFNTLKPISTSAMHSQALIQLKTNYCDKNKCLQCAVGNSLIKTPENNNRHSRH